MTTSAIFFPGRSMTLFAAVELAPRDPILGLNEQFAADPNPAKVNLAMVHNKRGENEKAEKLFREVLSAHPDLHEVRYIFIYILY